MRKNRKIVALFMCAVLTACSAATGAGAENVQAAALAKLEKADLKAADADTVQDTVSGSVTQTEPSEQPSGTPTSGAVQPTIPPLADTPTPPSVTATPSAVYAAGDKVTVANFQYSVVTASTDTKTGTVKVKGLVDKAKTKTTLVVPATITLDGYKFSVTGIGTRAFTTSTALKKVVMRKNITFVGIRAFQNVKTLQSVTIGEDVTTIKTRAFAGCSGLRSVTIPSKVKVIGQYSFYKCTKLKSVLIESKSITSVKTHAFNNNKAGRFFVIPYGKKSLYQSLLKSSGTTVKIYSY